MYSGSKVTGGMGLSLSRRNLAVGRDGGERGLVNSNRGISNNNEGYNT